MANLQLIKTIAERRNLTLESVAEMSGITPQQLHLIVRKNSTKIDTLEKIAKALKVPTGVFFEDTPIKINFGEEQNIESNEGKIIFKEITTGSADVITGLRKIIALYETIHPDLKEI